MGKLSKIRIRVFRKLDRLILSKDIRRAIKNGTPLEKIESMKEEFCELVKDEIQRIGRQESYIVPIYEIEQRSDYMCEYIQIGTKTEYRNQYGKRCYRLKKGYEDILKGYEDILYLYEEEIRTKD